MTRDEAIAAIDANWPTENYTMLREALTLAKDALRPATEDEGDKAKHMRDSQPRFSQYQMDAATKPLHAEIERLRSRPAPPDDLDDRKRSLRHIADTINVGGWAYAEDLMREHLAAPAPVAAPKNPPPCDAKEWACPTCGNDVLFHCTCQAVAAPAPSTAAPVNVPACHDGQHSYRRNAPPQNGDVCFVCRKSIWWETPAPDAMPEAQVDDVIVREVTDSVRRVDGLGWAYLRDGAVWIGSGDASICRVERNGVVIWRRQEAQP